LSGIQWDTPEAQARIAATFAITLVLAWLLHRGVELPAMRRWSRPRKADPAAEVKTSSTT
jgi:peptidoglycan/LPS O-acetylase OafA/YrhL